MCSFHCFRKLCPCLLNITAGTTLSYSTYVHSLLNISNKVPPYTKLSLSAFTRRTSGHSVWTLRAVKLFLPAVTSALPLTKHPTYSSASQPSKAVPWPRRSAPGISPRRQCVFFFCHFSYRGLPWELHVILCDVCYCVVFYCMVLSCLAL